MFHFFHKIFSLTRKAFCFNGNIYCSNFRQGKTMNKDIFSLLVADAWKRNLAAGCLEMHRRDGFAKSLLHEVRERISFAECTMSLKIIDGLLRSFFFLIDSRVAASRAVSYAICIEDVRFTCHVVVSRCRGCYATG